MRFLILVDGEIQAVETDTNVYDDSIKINENGTGDRSSSIEFSSDDTNAFGLEIKRYSGVNGIGGIYQSGIGQLSITTRNQGSIQFYTNNTGCAYFSGVDQKLYMGDTGINNFSTDGTLSGLSASDDSVPTEKAVKTYVDDSTELENDCINGRFKYWQRHASGSVTFPTTTTYHADCFRYANGATGYATTVSRELFSPGQVEPTGSPRYFCEINVTNAGTSPVSAEHTFDTRLIDIRRYAGKTVCLSFWASVASGTIPLYHQIRQNFDGTTSQVTSSEVVIGTVTTTWTKFNSFISIPALSASDDIGDLSNTAFRIHMPLTGTFTLRIAEVQIYISDKENNVRLRSDEEELKLCEPYCHIGIYNIRFVAAGASEFVENVSNYPSTMVKSPTLTKLTDATVNCTVDIYDASRKAARIAAVSTGSGGCYSLNQDYLAEAEL